MYRSHEGKTGRLTYPEEAEWWILKHRLSGVLTEYLLNVGVYDWAIENELFRPQNNKENSAEFIGGFSSASQKHFHYEDGELA